MNLLEHLARGFRLLFGGDTRDRARPQFAADLRQTLQAAVANQALRPGEQATILAALRAELLGASARPRLYRSAYHWLSATVACALTVLSLTIPWQAVPVARATVQALPAAELTIDVSRPMVVQRATQSATSALASSTPVPYLALHSSAALPIPSGTLDITVRE